MLCECVEKYCVRCREVYGYGVCVMVMKSVQRVRDEEREVSMGMYCDVSECCIWVYMSVYVYM